MQITPIQIPAIGFLRVSQIVGRPATKDKPAVPGIIPVGYSTWWANVASGKFPPGIKQSPRVTVWRVEDIRALVSKISSGEPL